MPSVKMQGRHVGGFNGHKTLDSEGIEYEFNDAGGLASVEQKKSRFDDHRHAPFGTTTLGTGPRPVAMAQTLPKVLA